eukprot:1562421-Pleurochrysis_carterae.AAC.3
MSKDLHSSMASRTPLPDAVRACALRVSRSLKLERTSSNVQARTYKLERTSPEWRVPCACAADTCAARRVSCDCARRVCVRCAVSCVRARRVCVRGARFRARQLLQRNASTPSRISVDWCADVCVPACNQSTPIVSNMKISIISIEIIFAATNHSHNHPLPPHLPTPAPLTAVTAPQSLKNLSA